MNNTFSGDENQDIEWKWSWNDEYLKWICGYANVKGGTIYIGVNDDGYVVGLENARELLEMLPNKITSKLGIIVDIKKESVFGLGNNIRYKNEIPSSVTKKLINRYACGEISYETIKDDDSNSIETEKMKKALLRIESEATVHVNDDDTVDYICISVSSFPFAVSYEGRYYKRSGSTLQLLEGLQLQEFLLDKAGRNWDELFVPDVSISDLDSEALQLFRTKAVAKGRMTESEVDVSDEILLKNLQLYDGVKLNKAAILLFHPNPERYVTGAYIKIAYFAPEGMYGENKYSDIIYHDDVHGPLIKQIDKVEEILYTKYLKAMISYEGFQRIETYMFTRRMLREMVLNPINHKDYASGVPIQISVYDDHIEIFNIGKWPEQLPLNENLYQKHESIPRNPILADAFYMSGEIEAWGTGFLKIKGECDEINAPYPKVDYNVSSITISAKGCAKYINLYNERIGKREGVVFSEKTVEQEPDIISKSFIKILELCDTVLEEKEKIKLYPIIEYLKTNDCITRDIAQEQCGGIGKTTAVKYLNRLCEIGAIYKDENVKITKYYLNVNASSKK